MGSGTRGDAISFIDGRGGGEAGGAGWSTGTSGTGPKAFWMTWTAMFWVKPQMTATGSDSARTSAVRRREQGWDDFKMMCEGRSMTFLLLRRRNAGTRNHTPV